MTINVLALPRFDFAERISLEVPEGSSVADMIAAAMPAAMPSQHGQFRVLIDDVEIEPRYYRVVRPKPGTRVIIRLRLGDDALRSVLSIAVTVAAIAVGQFYVGPLLANSIAGAIFPGGVLGLGGAVSGVGALASLSAAAGAIGLSIGGSLLLNALIPPRQAAQSGSDQQLQAIQGLQNNLSLNGTIPQVLGFFRYAPPYACRPSTMIANNDQYVNAGFNFGHGPLEFSDIKLGETPIDTFSDVNYEVLPGRVGDGQMGYCQTQIFEESLGVQLLHGQANTRLTASNITAFSFDLIFPQGLVQYDSKGKALETTIYIEVKWREVGSSGWNSQIVSASGSNQDPIRRSYTVPVSVRGQYEVQWTRLSGDYSPTDDKVFARSDLSLLRSHRPEYPIDFEFPLALLSLRIKATDQLNGVVNNLNAVVKSIVKDFNGTNWVNRASNNPAALFRHVLQGNANAFPVADQNIILSDLADWHVFCTQNGLTYNGVRDGSAALLDVLADVASAGRASPQIVGGRWTVVVDKPQTQVVSVITPKNSANFAGTIQFPTFPDGYRVPFFDETDGYKSTEMVVPWPGTDPNNVKVTEDLSLPGKTNPTEVFREARRRQYEAIYLRESMTVTQDIEALANVRGDLVDLSHDVLDRTLVAARIRAISGHLIEIDDTVEMNSTVTYACRVRRSDGSVVQFRVVFTAGQTSVFPVKGNLAGVAVGDLLMFGPATRVAKKCRIKAIDRGDNLSVNLTLVPYVPEIDDLVKGLTPTWPDDGTTGILAPPGTPSIPLIETSAAHEAIVHVTSGAGVTQPAQFTVGHRLAGGTSYVETTFAAGAGRVAIPTYAFGDEIEVRARAVGIDGAVSDWCAVVPYTLHLGPTADSTQITVDTTALTADRF